MANEYSAQANDGNTYTVTTDKHHDNHDENSFKKHLADIITQFATNVASGLVVHKFTYKGKK